MSKNDIDISRIMAVYNARTEGRGTLCKFKTLSGDMSFELYKADSFLSVYVLGEHYGSVQVLSRPPLDSFGGLLVSYEYISKSDWSEKGSWIKEFKSFIDTEYSRINKVGRKKRYYPLLTRITNYEYRSNINYTTDMRSIVSSRIYILSWCEDIYFT